MGEQDLRRVADLDQPFVFHLEDTDLESGSETVLDAAQNAIYVVVVAFELQYDINDVFQNFRPGDDAVLGDVSDNDDRGPVLLGIFLQQGRAFSDLGDAARR